MSTQIPDPRRWFALVLLCLTQLMVVLDVAIVNVALPSIEKALHYDAESIQWVVNAYTLVFGGFLLLGGRAADLLGRRRLFIAGLALFSAASLACGLATSDTFLTTARAVQGLGAAIISPAALSILMTTFAEGRERNTALGIWGAVAGAGGAIGVLAGGVLTNYAGWSWIFYVNVPIGLAVLLLAPRVLRESRVTGVSSFDVLGALTVTGGLSALVYALVKANDYGWSSARTLGTIGVAAALLLAFVLVESRSKHPLLPLPFFRRRYIVGANAVGLLLGASVFSMFYFLSFYQQAVLGYSSLKTGIGYLTVAITIVVSAGISQAFVSRFGVRYVLATGMALVAAGLVAFTQVSVGGSYVGDLVPGFLLAGAGLGLSFVPVSIAALEGVADHEAGIASGFINTSQQVGGALGIAVLVAVQTRWQTNALSTGDDQLHSLVHGFSGAFMIGAVLAAVGVVLTLLAVSNRRLAPAEAAGAAETATVTG